VIELLHCKARETVVGVVDFFLAFGAEFAGISKTNRCVNILLRTKYSDERKMSILVGGFFVVSVLDVVILEGILEEVTSLVEERKGDNGLGNSNTLSTEDTSHSEFTTITDDFLHGLDDTDGLAGDLAGLHNNFQSRERVCDNDVNRRNNGRGNQTSERSSHTRLAADFLLDVLLESRLSDETKESTGEGVSHQGDCSTEERFEILGGRLFENFHYGLGSTGLFEIGSLLLFNHSDRVDEGSRQDGSTSGGKSSGVLAISQEERNT